MEKQETWVSYLTMHAFTLREYGKKERPLEWEKGTESEMRKDSLLQWIYLALLWIDFIDLVKQDYRCQNEWYKMKMWDCFLDLIYMVMAG